tara:strand:- start:339 stop:1127 length:789 start_codon:yes stop_codon:yes gene_type:complete
MSESFLPPNQMIESIRIKYIEIQQGMSNTQNGFNDVVFTESGVAKQYSLSHLEGLSIHFEEFELESKQVVPVSIHVRPTNHLYTRRFEPNSDSIASSRLITRYEHHDGNFQAIKEPPTISTEKRIFCDEKYEANKRLPDFIKHAQENNPKCMLANRGDTRTCLSALIEVQQNNNGQILYYLVMFKLHRVNSKSINMLVETAFIVNADDQRAKRIKDGQESDKKPFKVLVRNILAKREPFEIRKLTTSRKKKFKAKKKEKNKN